jgi:hypothetical protein
MPTDLRAIVVATIFVSAYCVWHGNAWRSEAAIASP